MILILWYLLFMVAGDIVAYLIGRFIEYEWGSHVSLMVFLGMYFLSLWIAWLLSVWITAPKASAVQQS
jgi:CDP-diglyceride synthetase